jgi:hypothetical protein
MTNSPDQFKARIKARLLLGKRIRTEDGWPMFRTTRLSEYIRRLREDGLNIITEMVLSPNSRQKRGVYYIPRTKKHKHGMDKC